MSRSFRNLAAGFLSLTLLVPSAQGEVLSAVSNKSPEELSAEGRLLVGRAEDYVPSATPEEELSAVLAGSMLHRRNFAWQVVEQLLTPTKVKLGTGNTMVDVPRWQTWYEGATETELEPIALLFFRKMKAQPDAEPAAIAEETLDDYGDKNFARSLTDDQFNSTLLQFSDVANIPVELAGQGFTLFSPSFVAHMLTEARGVEGCTEDAPVNQQPADPTNFSPCIKEFPRSAVMVKTSWDELSRGIPQHDTSSARMATLMSQGTWGGGTQQQPNEAQIYTNVSQGGTKFGLRAIHFVTKDVRQWVWITLWWDPDANKDFGADRPASIAQYNGGVWSNYKMCVVSAFDEEDSEPWRYYTGNRTSLGEALRANYDAIRQQITQGPWSAPHDRVTSWCSNPDIESHPGNARTSCIGCHQASFSRHPTENRPIDFSDVIAGDVPQFGRSKYRQTFPADFAWSFGFEFQGELVEAREKAGFVWN